MSTKTFTERCHIAQQFLPDAQYKAMLTKLHAEMLAALAEQPAPAAQQEPSRYQELQEVLENLMSWQVKNVDKWHNGAYDQASKVLKRHDANPQAQPAQPLPAGFIDAVVEAAAILGAVDPDHAPKNMRWPLADELDGFVGMINAAPQAQPAPDEGVLYWDYDDGELGPSHDIESLLNNIAGNCDLEVGAEVHITRAIELPDMFVRVTKVSEDGDIEYEIITKDTP